MKVHKENALKIANYLEKHPKTKRTIYPGLPSQPQYDLVKNQMKNFSEIIVFQAYNAKNKLKEFVEKFEIIHYAVSLRHHRTLIFYMPSADLLETSFKLSTPSQLISWHEFAGDGIFRLSVGLEDAKDLIADFERALEVL